VTAAAADDLMRRVAGALATRGVAEGDRVVFALGNSTALLCALGGALRAGIVAVPLNPSLLPHERGALVADADPALVVDSPDALAALLAAEPVRDLAAVPRCRPMHYTSGTTGRPKGVWSGVLSDDDALALFAEEVDQWSFDDRDVHLVVSPLYHSAPLRFAIATLLRGGDVVVLPRFEAHAVSRAVAEHRPTTAFVVPAHLQRLFALGDDMLPPLGSFRLLLHAGAPCPPDVKLAAIDAFGVDVVWEFYGSTEGQFTVCSSPEWLDRPGTVGRARAERALAIDDEDGTIWCEVPPYARFSYWRDADKTSRAWRGPRLSGGERRYAFSVGDMGRLDGDGYLWLDGRRDDLVISGGVNVYPIEVEQALLAFPGVDDVAVFGVPDERWGQRVCAAVVTSSTVDTSALLAHARGQLAPYKVPKDVYLIDQLPHTSTGKVRRSAIAGILGL
jgi:long-chain acyl-CoA synthetase